MKAKSRGFKIIACVLTIIILNQSCTIYRSASLSVDEALESTHKLKIKTSPTNSYTFQSIGRDEAGLYGITRHNSKAAKQLFKDITQQNSTDDVVRIKLRESNIQEIKEQNKTLSVLVPLLVVAAGILTFALTYETGTLLPHGI